MKKKDCEIKTEYQKRIVKTLVDKKWSEISFCDLKKDDIFQLYENEDTQVTYQNEGTFVALSDPEVHSDLNVLFVTYEIYKELNK